MIFKKLADQSNMLGPSIPKGRLHLSLPVPELRRLVEIRRMERGDCDCCQRPLPIRISYISDVYDTPWEDSARVVKFCSNACEEEYLWEPDFAYFDCFVCYRRVCEQNPKNGWHSQDRILNGEQICLRCYEEGLLERGHDPEEFDNGLPGMFFSWGNSELVDAGFQCLETAFIGGTQAASALSKRALALIFDDGWAVVIAFESLGIGGSEGTVSLYGKPKKEEANDESF